ncbi:unnamed protein product [Nezara viridula]|uniref:Integrase catalytic domain-containing protein n=1 Tax=Nezara viridula TaxID=85310 RepID=A0A9P0EC82_NEZVI|nr:unnamed protein product [Nezara viridula]
MHAPPYLPEANGEEERQNRSLLKKLKIAKRLNLDWKDDLYKYLFDYRTIPHNSTAVSPAEIFFSGYSRTEIPQNENKNSLLDEELRDNDRWEKEKGKEYQTKLRKAVLSSVQKEEVKGLLVKAKAEMGSRITRNSSFFKTREEESQSNNMESERTQEERYEFGGEASVAT